MDHGLAVFTEDRAVVHRANTRKMTTTVCGRPWVVVAKLEEVDAAPVACATCWSFTALIGQDDERTTDG